MSQIDAIYQDGVFKPLSPIVLPENQRVQLEINPVGSAQKAAWIEAVLERKRCFVEKHGLLPDSTPDIAADRAAASW